MMSHPSKNSSIARRLTLVFFTSNAFTLIFTFVSFALLVFFYSGNSFKQELRSVTQVIASTSRAAVEFNDTLAGRRVLSGLSAKKDIIFGAIILPDGTQFSSYGTTDLSPKEILILSHQALVWNLPFLSITEPIVLENEEIGRILVISNVQGLYHQLIWFFAIGFLVLTIVILSVTFFSLRLRRWVVKPINTIRELAHTVSETQDFSSRLRIPHGGHDEIYELSRAFNHMLSAIDDRDQSLMHAKNRAESADRAKSMFVASISHEIRTPMHAILGATDEILATNVTPEQKELLTILKASGTSLLALINDVLDFSKIEAGKLSLNPNTFSIRRFASTLQKMFSIPYHKKGVNLTLIVDEVVPEFIYADSDRLSQILINLIGNALKFTPGGKDVYVSIRLAKNHDPSKNFLEFRVKDAGIGMSQEQLGIIFDPFTQIRDTNQAHGGGTGLGLSICSRLVSLMGGSMSVSSTRESGSEFVFTIQFESAAIDALDEIDNLSESYALNAGVDINHIPSEYLILLVEDNPVNQTMAARMLSKGGYRVEIVSNGQQCLNFLENQRVDLILMDLNMPGMDGLEATRHIRQREQVNEEHVPILALTANVTSEDVRRCYEAGMDGFLAKPISRQALLKSVKHHLIRAQFHLMQYFKTHIPNGH